MGPTYIDSKTGEVTINDHAHTKHSSSPIST